MTLLLSRKKRVEACIGGSHDLRLCIIWKETVNGKTPTAVETEASSHDR
jgi:hypothetical protein